MGNTVGCCCPIDSASSEGGLHRNGSSKRSQSLFGGGTTVVGTGPPSCGGVSHKFPSSGNNTGAYLTTSVTSSSSSSVTTTASAYPPPGVGVSPVDPPMQGTMAAMLQTTEPGSNRSSLLFHNYHHASSTNNHHQHSFHHNRHHSSSSNSGKFLQCGGAGDVTNSLGLGGNILKRVSFSESKVMAMFDKYKDPSEDAILSEGIVDLCEDLQLKPDDFRVLLLAWQCRAAQMCRFTRSEWLSGMQSLQADSIASIQARLPDVAVRVQTDPEQFADLYRWTFKFGIEPNQRSLPTDMAVQLWKLVFTQQEPPILERWLYFLEKHHDVRVIPRDTWNMFLHLCESVNEDLSTYDESEAWPSIFDDFVEYENDRANQNTMRYEK